MAGATLLISCGKRESGYFTLKAWKPHQFIRVVKNETYWDREKSPCYQPHVYVGTYFHPLKGVYLDAAAAK